MSLPAAYRLLHEDTTLALAGWKAPSTTQEGVQADFLRHLAAHPDAMWRRGAPAHFTASCIVLDRTGSRALLTLHRKAGLWLQFGGHFEPGDTGAQAAAQREAREESGIGALVVRPELVQLDRHHLAGSFGRCREHLDLRFVAIADDDAIHLVSHESLDVRWWPTEALPRQSRDTLEPLMAAARRVLDLS